MIRIGKALFVLNYSLDAVQLPCQKAPATRNQGPTIPKNSRSVWDDLKNTLKLKHESDRSRPNAAKVAADSCCGEKPYSSAISQCCLGRVIPLNETCCLNGKHVHENLLCQCAAPSDKWSQIESKRLTKLAEIVHRLTSSIGATISTMEERQKALNQQIFDLDQNGVHLMDNFYKLIGVERGDPEAVALEQSLLQERPQQRRRRMRRNYRFVEEYIPPEYAYEYAYEYEPEYEAEYDFNYEVEQGESGSRMLHDIVEVKHDYEEETFATADQVNLEKARLNIMERREIREQMVNLGQQQNVVDQNISSLRTLNVSLHASKAPIQNLNDAVSQSFSEADAGLKKCKLSDWDNHLQKIIDTVFTAYDNSSSFFDERKFDRDGGVTIGELRRIQYFHENYKRENSDYIDEENAEFLNDE